MARTFSKLMFQGKINAALQLLSQQGKGRVLCADKMIDLGDGEKLSWISYIQNTHTQSQSQWMPFLRATMILLRYMLSYSTKSLLAPFAMLLYTPRVLLDPQAWIPTAGGDSALCSNLPLKTYAML